MNRTSSDTLKTPHALDRSRHAAPQLYELLRSQIVELELPPGVALSRPALAARYRVSQTPVREALLRLEQERLVEVFPQSATRITLIDVEFARETHFLRRSIELELVRELALSPDAALVAELHSLLQEQERLSDAGDYKRFNDADMAFHRAMYRALDKDALWQLVRSRSGHLDRLRRLHLPVPGKQERIICDHRQILQAIERGDPEGARQALRHHLSGTLEYVAQIQAEHPQLLAPV